MFFSNEKGIFPLFGFVVVVDMLLAFFVDVVNLADVDENRFFLDIDFGWNEQRRINEVICFLGRGGSRLQTLK